MSDTTARIDLADYGRVRIEVALSGDVAADAKAITDALAAVNRATLDVISWADDDPADYRALADHLKDAWNGGPRAAAPAPATNGQSRPAPAQERPTGSQRRSGNEWAPGTGRFCSECDIEVAETKKEWQTYDDVDGVEVPAKWWHPSDRHEKGVHSVFRSRTYVPEGTSERPPWQGGSQQPVATAAGTAPPGPPPPEPPPDERPF